MPKSTKNAAANNRSNQMNPNHPHYSGPRVSGASRGGSTGARNPTQPKSAVSRLFPVLSCLFSVLSSLFSLLYYLCLSLLNGIIYPLACLIQPRAHPKSPKSGPSTRRAVLDNRSKQMNPESSMYAKSRASVPTARKRSSGAGSFQHKAQRLKENKVSDST